MLVKICGLKYVDAAQVAIDSGAPLLGVICVPGRSRTVQDSVAKQISERCHAARERKGAVGSRELLQAARDCASLHGPAWFENNAKLIEENGPYLVGVFRNQPIEEVLDIAQCYGLDFVQLHGAEDVPEYCARIPVPVIARYVLERPNIGDAVKTHRHFLPLLDSEKGGEGKLIDWDKAHRFYDDMGGRYILAGGLTPENVEQGLQLEGCLGVDVSGGVETDGVKDAGKIRRFVTSVVTYK